MALKKAIEMLLPSALVATELPSARPNQSVVNPVQIVASWFALKANRTTTKIGRYRKAYTRTAWKRNTPSTKPSIRSEAISARPRFGRGVVLPMARRRCRALTGR